MKVLVDSRDFYTQIQGIYALSGYDKDFIVQVMCKGKEVKILSGIGRKDNKTFVSVQKSDKKLGKSAVYSVSFIDVFEECTLTNLLTDTGTAFTFSFVVNDNVLSKISQLALNGKNIQIDYDDTTNSIVFTAADRKVVVENITVKYSRGIKYVNLIESGKKYKFEYQSFDFTSEQFLRLIAPYINKDAIDRIINDVITGNLYICRGGVYTMRYAFGVYYKTNAFDKLVDFIEYALYSNKSPTNYIGVYRIPYNVLQRIQALSTLKHKQYKVRFLITTTGMCNIILESGQDIHCWYWLQNMGNENDMKLDRALNTYKLKNGMIDDYTRQTLVPITSSDLRKVARLGLKPYKHIESGTVVYLDEKREKLHIKPISYASADTYDKDATMDNTFNFPFVAVDTAYLQSLISIITPDRGTYDLMIGEVKINSDFCKYNALYIQTKKGDIRAVLLPKRLN